MVDVYLGILILFGVVWFGVSLACLVIFFVEQTSETARTAVYYTVGGWLAIVLWPVLLPVGVCYGSYLIVKKGWFE